MQSHESVVPSDKYAVLASSSAFQNNCLRPASDVAKDSDPDIWFDRPPYGGAVEIAVSRLVEQMWRVTWYENRDVQTSMAYAGV
jgi:hypothetical protein